MRVLVRSRREFEKFETLEMSCLRDVDEADRSLGMLGMLERCRV
jgi:hypothetical protein